MVKGEGRNRKKAGGQTQIGTSSLVLIFTVLCLIVFCTLSLASAKADDKLAEKNEACVKDYYIADGKAEERLKQINDAAIQLADKAIDRNQFQSYLCEKFGDSYNASENSINYTIEVNEEQIIFIRLNLLSYDLIQEGQKNYKLVSWVVRNKVDYEIDDSMPVWDGETVN
jgi:hypothetical protein